MHYAILAYHPEQAVAAWSAEEDAALMAALDRIHHRLVAEGQLGPAARLDFTAAARTVRRPGLVTDGPFAETKEQLLGFYVVDCADRAAAVAIAQELRAVNLTAVYEVRPITLFLPGAAAGG